MKAIEIIVDPATLAFHADMSAEELQRRIAFLSSWAGSLRKKDFNTQVPPQTEDFLRKSGFFPAYEAVDRVIASLNLRHRYAPQDLIGPINGILQQALGRMYCCVKDTDHEDFTSTPAQPWHAEPNLNYQSQRAVVSARIEQILHDIPPALAFASDIPKGSVQFASELTIVDPNSLPGLSPEQLPKTITGQVTVVSDQEDVFGSIRAVEHWASADNNTEIKFAIQCRCRERLINVGTYTKFAEIPRFYVGSDFYESLRASQASGRGPYASVTLDACADAVLGTIEWKDFRKNLRVGDNAKPLRAHITKAGVALRLMAWERPMKNTKGILELANVARKFEEEIWSDDPSSAI